MSDFIIYDANAIPPQPVIVDYSTWIKIEKAQEHDLQFTFNGLMVGQPDDLGTREYIRCLSSRVSLWTKRTDLTEIERMENFLSPWKDIMNVTDLKTAHSELANLSGEDAILVHHRNSEAKVIITEAHYKKLTAPKPEVSPFPKLDSYESQYENVKALPKATQTMYLDENNVVHNMVTLGLLIAVTPMLTMVNPGIMDEFKAGAVAEIDLLMNRLVTDGYATSRLAPTFGMPMARSTMAEEYIVCCVPLVPTNRELPDYAKPYLINESNKPTYLYCPLIKGE